jgi:hypothetical protein
MSLRANNRNFKLERSSVMTFNRIALVALTVWVATSVSAFAQGAPLASSPNHPVRTATDCLDPLSQRVALPATPARTSASSQPTRSAQDAYAIYLQQYNRYLADYARYQRERANSGSSFYAVLNGISAGLQVADQAATVYQHAAEAKAAAAAAGR